MKFSMVWISVASGKYGGCMREKRNSERNLPVVFPLTKQAPLWLLALGIAMAPLFAASALADTYPLDSVDFTSVGGQTNIILHTGSIVPVQKVLVSNEKLILDIDQIDANDTIRTNFTGAGNISHVILQPLSEHKIRMIIRGEHLGTPSLAFYNAGNGSYSSPNAGYTGSASEADAPIKSMQESVPSAAALSSAQADSLSAMAEKSKPNAKSASPVEGNSLSATPWGKPSAANANFAGQNQEKSPLSLPESPTKSATDLLDGILSGPLTTYLPYALLGVLILGLGLFVRNKIMQLQSGPPQLEELLEEQSQGKRISFREMADAYRHKHDDRNTTHENTGKSGNRKASTEDPIGLRALNQMDMEWEQSATLMPQSRPTNPQPAAAGNTTQPPSMQQLLAALQKAQSNQPTLPKPAAAPKKQVAQQYAQAQNASKTKPQARSASEQRIQEELKRAQQIQQELEQQMHLAKSGQPVNRALAAQKSVKPFEFKTAPASSPVNRNKPSPKPPIAPMPQGKPAMGKATNPKGTQQGPLPGNPEVLNFLRNVAELMEKDGKPDIAKNIHKNLSSQNLGLMP
jgi:hypothetical protein